MTVMTTLQFATDDMISNGVGTLRQLTGKVVIVSIVGPQRGGKSTLFNLVPVLVPVAMSPSATVAEPSGLQTATASSG